MNLLLTLLLTAAGPFYAAQSVSKGAPLSFRATPVQGVVAYHAARTDFTRAVDAIAAIPAAERTFANTIKAFDDAGAAYNNRIQHLIFLKQVSAEERLRNAADLIEDDANKFGVALMQREDLHRAVMEYAARGEALSPEDRRLLDFTVRDLKNAGMGLSAEDRARLKRVQDRLGELAADFEKNVNEHKDQLELSLEELAGLPPDYIEGLRRTADGKYAVGLSYPEYVPFMTYAENGEKRRELALKYSNRAAPENLAIMAEAVRLRDESAKILGYADYPSWRLDNNRMAGTPERVMAFLNGLLPRLMEKGKKELAELVALKRKDDPAADALQAWERLYYSEKLRRARYDFDPEEAKKYFPVDRVVEGALRTYERVLGVRYEEVPNDEDSWHPEVRLFAVFDAASGARLGHFYLDLHPRDNKYTHAAMFPIVASYATDAEGRREPVAAVVTNFPRPVGGRPATLDFGDVSTFFHEFGHAMHHVLTEARHASLAGTSVPWDFVEAPSQMLENFVLDREVLDAISGLPEDPSQKLPEELRLKMLAAAKAFTDGGLPKGLHYLRQVSMALADMMMHATVPANVSALFNQVMETIGLTPVQPGSNFLASFGHMMGGYTAGYYSYLWAEVIAADIFSAFKREGLFGPAGMRYRRTVLAGGNARPIDELLTEFLGRATNDKAFMDELFGEEAAPAAAGR